jgi:predicted small metal-binding protein
VDRVLQCDCGFEARATDEDGLVDQMRRHARDVHGMALTRNEALQLVAGAERRANALPRASEEKEET